MTGGTPGPSHAAFRDWPYVQRDGDITYRGALLFEDRQDDAVIQNLLAAIREVNGGSNERLKIYTRDMFGTLRSALPTAEEHWHADPRMTPALSLMILDIEILLGKPWPDCRDGVELAAWIRREGYVRPDGNGILTPVPIVFLTQFHAAETHYPRDRPVPQPRLSLEQRIQAIHEEAGELADAAGAEQDDQAVPNVAWEFYHKADARHVDREAPGAEEKGIPLLEFAQRLNALAFGR